MSGFYGKLPLVGDFVTRRLPSTFIDPWDSWLQAAIACSKEQLEEQWLDVYLGSPIWRFVLSSGLCGDVPWAGAIMPSVDKVGRYFPLTVAVSTDRQSEPCLLAVDAIDWFQSAESALLAVLEEEISLEEFDQKVDALGSVDSEEKVVATVEGEQLCIDAKDSPVWRVSISSVVDVKGVFTRLAHDFMSESLSRYSLWWTDGSDDMEPGFLVFNGLPPVKFYSSLLGGSGMSKPDGSNPDRSIDKQAGAAEDEPDS